MISEDAGKWLEQANPFPKGREESWATSEEGRAILAHVLEHPLPPPSTRTLRQSRLVRPVAVSVLAVIALSAFVAQVALHGPLDVPAETGLVETAVPSSTATSMQDTDPNGFVHGPATSDFEALVGQSHQIVGGVVAEVAAAVEPGSLDLGLTVVNVWKGEGQAGGALRVFIPGPLWFTGARDQSAPTAADRSSVVPALVGQYVILIVKASPVDSTSRSLGLDGGDAAYVQVGTRLDRLRYFLTGEPDPDARRLGDLQAALKTGKGSE